MRILVVEDDAILALMAAEALTLFGYEVIGPAHTVEECLKLAGGQPIDLAFVDINLAGRDEGIALARQLRERHAIHSIFVSGQVAAARSHREAALGLLPKPYLLEDLDRSARFARAWIDGANPPPPAKPAKLELFS
jgi:CheY-like chemotaxis protein